MAANSTCLQYPLCVKWTTDLPYECTPRKSPNINFRDFECYLHFKFDSQFQEYKLTLRNKTNTVLKNMFMVTTYVQQNLLTRPILIEQVSICSGEEILWCKTRKEILDLIPNIFDIGKLTIICTFHSKETNIENSQTDIVSPSRSVSINLNCLPVHFSKLLDDKTFVDVKLKCADRTFSAHKSVLSVCSDVFASRLRDKIAAKDADLVEIENLEPQVLEQLIKYMYSGEIPDLSEEETARSLYQAAAEYNVYRLQGVCSDWLVRNLTPENCLELLEFADEQEDEDFVEQVACFVAKHLRVLNRESWSTLKEDSPSLAIKVYEKLWTLS